MIIISAGFMKSASTLLHDYQVEVIKTVTKKNGQKELERFSSGRGAAYRGNLDFKTFLILLYINFRYGDVVLKTHGAPTIYVKLLVDWGLAKVTYTYRDPRDVALSMLDHGIKTREKLVSADDTLKSSVGFRDVCSVKDAMPRIQREINIWYKWKTFEKKFSVKYESFMDCKLEYLRQMIDYLGYEISESQIQTIFEKYESTKSRNFNKGIAERFKAEMKSEEIDLFNKNFGQDLVAMGYIF
jgi:uncharacterized protein (DUF302 family)